ncbi:unnamed protein product [Sphenostylis stenocarpa]|uniref:Uncharacterized protein n=1 Tax=Sphenostylis stenocarpa TaxID=92480 RepID=A0AA86SKS8_9FABA|nr:unnamed protein product [Sphenostylis stenocarpa]
MHDDTSVKVEQCGSKHEGRCRDKTKSLKLKVIAMFGKGFCLRRHNCYRLHVHYAQLLSISYVGLPIGTTVTEVSITTFIVMISAILTLAINSYSISFFKKKLTAITVNGSSSLETGEVKEA